MELTVIQANATTFVDRCRGCRHGDGQGRCNFRSPLASTGDLLAAWACGAQDRPTARNYAARLAVKSPGLVRPESSWWQTMLGLGTPCPEYTEEKG